MDRAPRDDACREGGRVAGDAERPVRGVLLAGAGPLARGDGDARPPLPPALGGVIVRGEGDGLRGDGFGLPPFGAGDADRVRGEGDGPREDRGLGADMSPVRCPPLVRMPPGGGNLRSFQATSLYNTHRGLNAEGDRPPYPSRPAGAARATR